VEEGVWGLEVAKAEDVARWMFEEVKRVGYLHQRDAAHEISSRFGSEFTYETERGADATDRRVLKAFREITGEQVVWVRRERLWRMRTPHDKPGVRQQDE
jgi:hypothetical protein